MKIKELKANPDNPRTISDAKLAQLKKALLEFGDLSGIVFNRKSKQLAGGHQRLKHLDPEAPITIVKKYSKPTKTGTVAEGFVEIKGERFSYREVYWSEHKEKAANIAANKGAGEWDLPKLGEWIKDLNFFDADFDMSLTMFDDEELKEFGGITVAEHTRSEATGVEEDEVPEKSPVRTVPGDIYILGRHRLLCGDSTDSLCVDKLMNGQKADMVFTDPPYNQPESGGKNDLIGRALHKQTASISHMINFEPTTFLKVLPEVFSRGHLNAYVFTSKDLLPEYLTWAEENGYSFNVLVWKKPNALPIGGSHRPDIEYLLVFRKSGTFNSGIEGVSYSKVLEHGRETDKVHPTMKPVALIENQLKIASDVSSVVIDLFGGSGSTMIAAEKTNRKCFMMEIDPHYCDVIVDRWERYTGLKAKRVPAPKTVLRKTAKPSISGHAAND